MEPNKNNDTIFELTQKILEDGTVVDLKQERQKHKIAKEEQLFIGTQVQNVEDDEDGRAFEAYMKYREQSGDLGLKSHLRKVNVPEVNNVVSVFTHEDNLLVQSIVVSIVLLVKPLFSMNVNLPNEENNSDNLSDIKQYITKIIPSVRAEIISRYSGGKAKKIDYMKKKEVRTFSLDEKIIGNLSLFNEMLLSSFLLWAKLTFENEQITFENDSSIEEKLGQRIDNFIEKEFEGIFEKINC